MRVLQLIDTLEAGGAERMAVNLANLMSDCIDVSYLCSTRKEGILKNRLSKNVKYKFLEKTATLDIKAVIKLYNFVKKEKINIIHAHSSSFFLAVIVGVLLRDVKIIWHDHYGNSEYLSERPKFTLKYCSYFFSHSFAVNEKLLIWAQNNLKHDSISYLSNFIDFDEVVKFHTKLEGQKGKRIVCLANLRPQKDHLTLLKAFSIIEKKFPEYTLHCIGVNFNDEHSIELNSLTEKLKIKSKVFFYGSCPDVKAILANCDIGVLSSKSEGLPLALLEYGEAKLPVVVTDVGDCKKVVKNNFSGLLVPKENPDALALAIEEIIVDEKKAKEMGINLKDKVYNEFSSAAVVQLVMETYKSING